MLLDSAPSLLVPSYYKHGKPAIIRPRDVMPGLIPAVPAFSTGSAFPIVAATNTSESASSVSAHSVNLPASISANDLLIILFEYAAATPAGTTTCDVPAGWNGLATYDNGESMASRIYWKIASGGEGASVTINTSSGRRSTHTSLRITGAATTGTPLEASTPVYGGGSVTTIDPASLAPSWGAVNTLWLAVLFGRSSPRTVTAYPASYTLYQQTKNNSFSGVGGVVAIAGREVNTATEDPGAYTIDTSTNLIGSTIGIKPV